MNKNNAFSIWTLPVLAHVQLAKTQEYALTYGIANYMEIWFRFTGPYLATYLTDKTCAMAFMERRGN